MFHRNAFRAAAVTILGLALLPSVVRAADEKAAEPTENPRYTYWAKFKPGSTITMTGELTAKGGNMTMELVATLMEVEKDKLTIEKKGSVVVNGQKMEQPATKDLITPAAKPGEVYKPAGEEELTVAGKAYKCKIYEMEEGDGPAKTTTRVWVSEQVPGGAVKLTKKSEQMSGTFTLKSYEAK